MNRSRSLPEIDGYWLSECIGTGAASVVYKAQQARTGRWVAIKLFARGEAGSGRSAGLAAERFTRETELVARLSHPHIVNLLDKGQTRNGDLYAVFEHVPGVTLHDLLMERGALPPEEAAELMGQVLDALVAAHEQGIVHRDLKPTNIMVSRGGARPYAKLLDFGVGALTSNASPVPGAGHSETAILGTPRYCAPEQLRGEPPTEKSDLYAWGLILVECLTGVPVIRAKSLSRIYHEQLSPSETPLPADWLHHPLGKLLREILRKKPQERPFDARALHAAFRQIDLRDIAPGPFGDDPDSGSAGFEPTVVSEGPATERRQITLLCHDLEIVPGSGEPVEIAAMEEALNSHAGRCASIGVARGAHPAGELGFTRIWYFGYPRASDRGALQAARAALELVSETAQAGGVAEQRHGFGLRIRVALHTGFVVVRQGATPAALAAKVAAELLQLAGPNEILVSGRSRTVLERHFALTAVPLEARMEDGRSGPVFRLESERVAPAVAAPEPLCGRDEELAALQRMWGRAREGEGGAVMLIGEPGIGKTHLAHALCEQVRRDGGRAWVLHCQPEQSNSALYPFLQWLIDQFQLPVQSDPAGATDRLQAALQELGLDVGEMAPILCAWLSLPIPRGMPVAPHAPERQRRIIFDLLRGLLRSLAGGPALLVLEDVHWLDPTSRLFMDGLLKVHAESGLGLLLTARPDCDYRPPAERLELSRLGPADAAHLVQRVLGERVQEDSGLADLITRADGNPLYLIELARARGTVLHTPGPGQAADAGAEIPATLREVLSQALDRLGAAKETAQLAATFGREFEPELLVAASPRDEASVRSNLEQMVLADIVYRRSVAQSGVIGFRHALIRDAAYDSMTVNARRQAHGRVARVLEAADAEAHALSLSQHFASAAHFDRAVRYGVRAARQLLGRAAHDEAINQLELARGWVDRAPASERNTAALELNLVATQAMMSKYGWADSRVRVGAERSHALLAGIDNREQAGAALWALATYHHVAGDRVRTLELARKMVALSGETPALWRAAHALQGIAHWIDGDYREAAASLEVVLRTPAALDDEDAVRFGLDCRCWSMAALANVHWFLADDEAGAFALSDAAIAAAENINHIPTLGLTLMYRGFLHQHRGDRKGAAEVCGRLLDLSRRYSLPAIEAYAACIDCWVRGESAALSQILESLQGMGCQLGLTYLGSFVAELNAESGDVAGALVWVERCLTQAANTGERYFEAELLLQKADLLGKGDATSPSTEILPILTQAIACAEASGMESTRRRAAAQLDAWLTAWPHRGHDHHTTGTRTHGDTHE